MAASTTVHAMVSLTWFAFSLGLAVAGEQAHRPGELIAAGMTGYGLASTLSSTIAPLLVNRLAAWPTAILPPALLGLTFLALAQHLDSLVWLSLLSAVGGLTMPIGIAAHNRLLATQPTAGPERRAAFAADQLASGGAGALGMLAGGAVIGVAGAPRTLVAAGIAQLAAVFLAWFASQTRRRAARPAGSN